MAAAKPKIREITDKIAGTKTLVKSATEKEAINYVTNDRFEARLPTSEELFAAGQAGARVVDLTVKGE